MFTQDEMRFLRDCSENEIMDDIIHKMTLVNSNGRPVVKNSSFTDQEMSSLRFCAEDQTLEDHDREMISSIMHKIAAVHSAPKPQILITINGGAFQFAHANMDIELVIEDQDNIVNGDDLYYPCLAGDTQEEFDKQVQKAYEQVIFAKARKLKNEPIIETRIFIHDPEDAFPFNIAVNGDVIATYKTFDEANQFLTDYLAERKQC